MVMLTLYAKQKKRHRCTEQTFGILLVLISIPLMIGDSEYLFIYLLPSECLHLKNAYSAKTEI